MDSSIIVISKFMELDVAGMCVLFKATNSILRNCCFCFVFTINYEKTQHIFGDGNVRSEVFYVSVIVV